MHFFQYTEFACIRLFATNAAISSFASPWNFLVCFSLIKRHKINILIMGEKNIMDNIFLDLTTALLNLVRPVISALSPLLTGLVIAYLLNRPVSLLEARIQSRILSIIITYLAAAGIISALLWGFIILITGSLPRGGIEVTLRLVQTYFTDAVNAVNDFISGSTFLSDAGMTEAIADKIKTWLADKFSFNSFVGLITTLTGGLISLLLGTVASVYLLNDKEYFTGLWEKFLTLILNQRTHGLISETISQINTVITTFIKGALIDSVIVAFLSSLALTAVRVDFAVIIGVICGIMNVIPYFGPFISMIPAVVTALFSGGITHGIAAAAALFIVQQLDSNYIYPKIVGSTIGLHPLFVLLAVSVCGYFFGVFGMLLAVPAAGVIQVLITRWAYSK